MRASKAVVVTAATFLLIVSAIVAVSARRAYAARADWIPKSYGALKGTMGASLIFEDKDGTIRLVNIDENRTITIARH